MGFEKNTVKWMFGGLAALLLLLGLIRVGVPAEGYITSLVLLIGAGILLIELGLKRLTPLSKLKKLGVMQWITLVVAIILVFASIIALPVVSLNVPFIDTVGIIAIFVAAIMAGLEAFTA